jgi:pyrimidine operon attenuation protein / uracil phosphoribosyltransferase
MAQDKHIVLEKDELGRTINRMAHEIVEKTPNTSELALIGIRSRGVHLARRIARKIGEFANVIPPVGTLDVTSYRDDRSFEHSTANVSASEVPFSLDDKTVVLIDDVIFRGRTIRAAMEALARLGQPKRILVAVLVDRGARELPIRADVVGKNVAAGEGERVNVLFAEADGIDQVTVSRWQGRAVT